MTFKGIDVYFMHILRGLLLHWENVFQKIPPRIIEQQCVVLKGLRVSIEFRYFPSVKTCSNLTTSVCLVAFQQWNITNKFRLRFIALQILYTYRTGEGFESVSPPWQPSWSHGLYRLAVTCATSTPVLSSLTVTPGGSSKYEKMIFPLRKFVAVTYIFRAFEE